jgi:outer membrane protein TolC
MVKRILLALFVLSSLSIVLALDRLNLDKAKEMVLENNLEYLSVQASRDKADYNKKSAFYSYLPSGNFTGNHTRYEPELMMSGKYSNQFGLTLNQPLLANGSIYYRNKVQAENSKSANISVRQKRVELLTQVEILYYNVLESQKNLQLAQTNVERAWKAYESGKISFQQNVLSKAQLLRLQVDATNKAISQLNSKNAYSDAYRALQLYLNSDDDFSLEEVDFIAEEKSKDYLKMSGKFALNDQGALIKDTKAYTKLLNKLLTTSIQENPQIAIAKTGINLAQYSLKQEQSSFLPSLNLSLNHNWSANELATDYEDQTSIMLNASISFFPLMNKVHNVNSQKMNLKQVNYNYQALLKDIKSRIETSLNNYLISLERIELAGQTLRLNQEIFKEQEAKFQNNLISVDDYLDSQAELDQASLQYNSSLYGLLKSQSNLAYTIGFEDSSQIANIITLILEEQ